MARLGKYKHFKGEEFEVIGNVLLEAEFNDKIAGVLYKHLGDTSQLYVRSERNFFEEVDVDDLTKGPRFVFVEELPSGELNAANFLVIHDTLRGSLAIVGPDAPWGFTEKARNLALQKVGDTMRKMKVSQQSLYK